MKKILLVKTSSMGDVVHNLPVAGDIRAAYPDCSIDWVVEESFAAIPRLHPAVARVVPVAIRRWRGRLWRRDTRGEIGAFMREVRAQPYDAVIDTQGLFKSALLARIARGTHYGPAFASAREPASFLYDRTYAVSWTQHAVERNRALAAQSLNYAVRNGIDYGISAPPARFVWLPDERYAVLLHASSARDKQWPEERWSELGARLGERGVRCVLPWGSTAERLSAERIAHRVPRAVVAPELSLADAAAVIAGAWAVAGVDTGLTHLAVALGRPTAGIYCATDPAATGLYGSARAVNLGGAGKPPATSEVVAALAKISDQIIK